MSTVRGVSEESILETRGLKGNTSGAHTATTSNNGDGTDHSRAPEPPRTTRVRVTSRVTDNGAGPLLRTHHPPQPATPLGALRLARQCGLLTRRRRRGPRWSWCGQAARFDALRRELAGPASPWWQGTGRAPAGSRSRRPPGRCPRGKPTRSSRRPAAALTPGGCRSRRRCRGSHRGQVGRQQLAQGLVADRVRQAALSPADRGVDCYRRIKSARAFKFRLTSVAKSWTLRLVSASSG